MKASWKKGYHSRIEADIAYKELEKIRKDEGDIKPEVVIQRAKDKDSPLHNAFEWSNAKAAHQHRLDQARRMTRNIEIIRKEMPEHPTRAFDIVRVATPKDKKPTRNVYKTVEEILQDPLGRDELLARAIREAISYRKKYHMLSELAKIFQVLDEVIENADEMIA